MTLKNFAVLSALNTFIDAKDHISIQKHPRDNAFRNPPATAPQNENLLISGPKPEGPSKVRGAAGCGEGVDRAAQCVAQAMLGDVKLLHLSCERAFVELRRRGFMELLKQGPRL